MSAPRIRKIEMKTFAIARRAGRLGIIFISYCVSGRAPILNKTLDTIVHFYIKVSFHINLKDSTAKCGSIVSFLIIS